ncbi:hypothetical protein T01_7994 [Trichinella spiralis]|uniref:Uncharacterized protein n=1 Tax=Trichinella spiralis TaxID=6334 RepID=A0A0V0Z6Q6_TRISP|nr:hypothetical protein T01_7994 [Trichinella spiralis]
MYFYTCRLVLLFERFSENSLQSEFEAALTAILLGAVLRFLFAFKVFYTDLSEFIR